MRALLGSGGFRGDERRALYNQEMRRHFGDVDRILFIPYALHDHEAYTKLMTERGLDAGYEIDGIHRHEDPVAAVMEAPAISVGGGNTFRLIADLHRLGLVEAIRNRVVNDDIPYMGVSAGTNVACPTMQTTNDMPITQPSSFQAIGLVPFQVNAHYYAGSIWVRHDGEFVEHFGETRDDRIREFHEMNDTPVVGLWEAGFIRVEDDQFELIGSSARVFRKGCDAYDVEPGCKLVELA
ncbi:MAG: dipeptidase PepE [Phycisphaerales bacterium]|nr:dipeptidase PepE [Phycisphaerales bacterium]